MYIHYDSYRIFYYVAKYRSFTQAAAMLLCNQPNVTRTIKNLESDLGCALFIRSNRGVRLTPEGERLYEHVRIAVEHIEAGEREIALDRSLSQGTVSIGAKILTHNFTYVLAVYVLNLLFVSVNLLVYVRNRRLDRTSAQ